MMDNPTHSRDTKRSGNTIRGIWCIRKVVSTILGRCYYGKNWLWKEQLSTNRSTSSLNSGAKNVCAAQFDINIILVDSPGFDDTTKSDLEVLGLIIIKTTSN